MPKRKAVTFDLDALKPDPPKIIEVRLSEDGLKEVVLQIGKRTIVVSEANYFSDARFGKAVNQMLEDPLEDDVVQAMTLTIYPALYACSDGDLPDHHQIIKMSKVGLKLWIENARKLNPSVGWFRGLDEIEQSLDEASASLNEQTSDALVKEVEKKG